MNIIHICILIGVWVVAMGKTISFINLRDTYIKSQEVEKPKELLKAQKDVISYLVLAVIYTIYKVL